MSVSLSGSTKWPRSAHETVIHNFLQWYDIHKDELLEDTRTVVDVLLKNEHHDDDDQYLLECYGIEPGVLHYGCHYGQYYWVFDELGEKFSRCSPDVPFEDSTFADCDWCTTHHAIIKNGEVVGGYRSELMGWLCDKSIYANVTGDNDDIYPTEEFPTGYYYVDEGGSHSVTKEQFDEMMEEFQNTPEGITPIWRW